MSIIKQISVYNGSTWDTDDIGADASNITITAGTPGTGNAGNLQTALNTLGNSLTTLSTTVNVLNNAPKIFTGTDDPTITPPSGSDNGDIYIWIVNTN